MMKFFLVHGGEIDQVKGIFLNYTYTSAELHFYLAL